MNNQRSPRGNFRQAGNSHFGRRRNSGPAQNHRGNGRFAPAAININKFINKATGTPQAEQHMPAGTFAQFRIDSRIHRALEMRKFTHPTEIQEKTIQHILAGKDVIGLANTGTGKTGAFLLPMIDKMLKNPREKLLVVVPTRELAIQIQEEFVAFTHGIRMQSVVVVGGTNMNPQITRLRQPHNVVIGTPGRLKDLIQRKVLFLNNFTNVVLDEADRMLDMGFINDVKYLLSLVAPKRQTLFFSATLSPEIEQLVAQFLHNPIKVAIAKRETSAMVDQDIVKVPHDGDKLEILHDLLSKSDFQKVLIFTRTKYGADKLSRKLYQRGFKTDSIHGNKTHGKRQKALQQFKDNHIEILVATDVAARGLDIPNVSHVINFDTPATYEDYIHRIGRTGRANNKGIALTFVN